MVDKEMETRGNCQSKSRRRRRGNSSLGTANGSELRPRRVKDSDILGVHKVDCGLRLRLPALSAACPRGPVLLPIAPANHGLVTLAQSHPSQRPRRC